MDLDLATTPSKQRLIPLTGLQTLGNISCSPAMKAFPSGTRNESTLETHSGTITAPKTKFSYLPRQTTKAQAKSFPILDLQGDFFTQLPYKPGSIIAAGMTSHIMVASRRDKPHIKVALKVMDLRGNHLNEGGVRSLFLSELTVFRKTDHPGLVKCHLAARSPDRLVFAMKLYPHGDLTSHLHSLPAWSKMNVSGQLSAAVSYLHHKNIMHGDIKLDNVFLDHGFRPVLGDFGLARLIPTRGAYLPAIVFGGTRQYWSPEVRGQDVGTLVDPFKVRYYHTFMSIV